MNLNDNNLKDFYKDMTPVELIRELGEVFATVLAGMGHNIDNNSPLMNGLVAYQMLKLKGESEMLDKAVDTVMKIVLEESMNRINARKDT